MHQLAVVGGVRNVNGVPGVFGPADGRGQCCMAFLFRFFAAFFVCALMDLKQFSWIKKAAQCHINWPLEKHCPFFGDLSVKNAKPDHQFSRPKPNPNMILLNHVKTN